MSDHLVAAELIANVILLVAKEPKPQWASIVTGSALDKTNKFSWAKYFGAVIIASSNLTTYTKFYSG
jgi:hypothetical protein